MSIVGHCSADYSDDNFDVSIFCGYSDDGNFEISSFGGSSDNFGNHLVHCTLWNDGWMLHIASTRV